MKRSEDSFRNLWGREEKHEQISQKKKRKKMWEKIFEDILVESLTNM